MANVAGFKTFIRLPNNAANLIRVDRMTSDCIGSIGRRLGINSRMAIGILDRGRNGVTLSVGGTISEPRNRSSCSRHPPHRKESSHHNNSESFHSGKGFGPGRDFRSGVTGFLGSDRRGVSSLGHGARKGQNNQNKHHNWTTL